MNKLMTAPRYPAPAVRLILRREALGSSCARVAVHHAQAAYDAVAPVLQDLAQERFIALLLESQKRLISVVTVAEGTVNTCTVDPRILFAAALVGGAHAVIVAHNHPCGDSTPSTQDLELTRALVGAGKLLRLPVLDHIIIGTGTFTSVRTVQPDSFIRSL